MNRLLHILLCLASLCLVSSCTINPVIYTDAKGRDVAWLGGSIITKSKDHLATIQRPDGTVITNRIIGKDEVAGLRYWAQAQAAEAIAAITGSVTKHAASQETARQVSDNAVKTTAITAPLNADVAKAQIAAEAASP